MTPEQALQVLTEVTGHVNLTRPGHIQVSTALQVLAAVVKSTVGDKSVDFGDVSTGETVVKKNKKNGSAEKHS